MIRHAAAALGKAGKELILGRRAEAASFDAAESLQKSLPGIGDGWSR